MAWDKLHDRPNRLGEKENICWSCDKAVGKCPWSAKSQPVEGWDADPDTVKANMTAGPKHNNKRDVVGYKVRSYKIYDCPLYEEMRKRVIK